MAPMRDRPRNRQVDVAEQDDQHHARRDHAEERGGLELLQQVVRRQEVGVGERAKEQEQQDAGERDRRRLVEPREQFHHPFMPAPTGKDRACS